MEVTEKLVKEEERSAELYIPILKNDSFQNHLESFPDCENVFCT